MEPSDLLQYLVRALERMEIPYLITGSMATIYYGEPRLTNDIDVVAKLTDSQAEQFCEAFPSADYYVDLEDVRAAIKVAGQFNIIHPASGLKIDVMIPDASAFNESRFARAVLARPASGYTARFASAEDVIVKKLQYFREGGSDKHLRDIAGVLQVSEGAIDRAYVEEWARKLRVIETWNAVLRRVDNS